VTLHRRLLLGAAILCALAAPSAQGAITPTLVSLVPNVDGTFTYTYRVRLAEDQNAVGDLESATPTGGTTPTGPGVPSSLYRDYFTIYDFAGLVPGSQVQPAGWISGSSLIGPTPSTTSPADDPNLFNVFWYRSGFPVLGPADLGSFSVRSAFGSPALDSYTSDATRSQGPTAGTAVASIGTVNVPQATGGCPAVGFGCGGITEPGTAMMLVTGLLAISLYQRRTR
jgi:hypothetical protein